MITPEQVDASSGSLSSPQIISIKFMIEELNKLIESPQITNQKFKDLKNIQVTLNSIVDTYMWKIIYLSRRNILDTHSGLS